MGEVEWRENPAGVRALLASAAVAKVMERIAENVRIEAERLAPVDTGAYAFGLPTPKAAGGGFKVAPVTKGGAAGARVSNNVRSAPSKNWPNGYGYGWALEFGNSRIKKQRILGRALDAATQRLA